MERKVTIAWSTARAYDATVPTWMLRQAITEDEAPAYEEALGVLDKLDAGEEVSEYELSFLDAFAGVPEFLLGLEEDVQTWHETTAREVVGLSLPDAGLAQSA